MSAAALEQLGLQVHEAEGLAEAELQLFGAQIVNPLSSAITSRVRFQVVGEALVVIEPPELVGLPALQISQLSSAKALEGVLATQFNDLLTHLSRRSSELAALGLAPKVDKRTLELTTELEVKPYRFTLECDRSGQFRVTRAVRDGAEVTPPGGLGFELSEFREKQALAAYLMALFGETMSTEAAPAPRNVHFGEVLKAFSPHAQVPPRSSLEVLIELKVGDDAYRFAAARVSGRTFRGLLAGQGGNKLWADRFELDDFPGVEALVARVLDVPMELVEVVQ